MLSQTTLFQFLATIFLALPVVSVGGVSLSAQPAEPDDEMVRSLLIRDSVDIQQVAEDMDIFSVGMEVCPSSGSGSFFDGYQRLGGQAQSLGLLATPTVMGRVRISDHLRIVLGSSYIGTGFTDLYTGTRVSPDRGDSAEAIPVAQIFEDMSITAVPFFAGIQFSPIRSQFTTYLGATVGGAWVTTNWSTSPRPLENVTYFRPETNVEGSTFAPVVRLYSGLDLRFDRFFMQGNLFRGIYIEAAYLYLPSTRNYFSEVRTIGRGVDPLPTSDDATINLGGFTITVGANMQLSREGS